MHRNHVIATCCYCGNRAALNLGGTAIRHELACAGCGAPLSRLKKLPSEGPQAPRPLPAPAGPATKKARKPAKQKKARKRRGLNARLFDFAEDVLDEFFD